MSGVFYCEVTGAQGLLQINRLCQLKWLHRVGSITSPLPSAIVRASLHASGLVGLCQISTLLKLTDINNEGNKKMYSAPFRNAVMSPRWPFNWKYLDGVLPATVMHHSLMACQERLGAFCWRTFFIATSADYERANELCFRYNFSGSCSSKSGDFNFETSPILSRESNTKS